MLMLIRGHPGGHGQSQEEGTDEPAAGKRWEPWTRASLAAPAFACLYFGLLVVLDEAFTRAFRLLWL